MTVLGIDEKALGLPFKTSTEVLDSFGTLHFYMSYLLKNTEESKLECEITAAFSLLQTSLQRWALTFFFFWGKSYLTIKQIDVIFLDNI